MKLFVILFLLLPPFSPCAGQITERHRVNVVRPDSSVTLLDIFWLLSEKSITTHHQKDNYFYRSIIISQPEGKSEYEGESADQLYILKGEYGEYPEGIIYYIGDYLNIQSISILFDSDSVSIVLDYGNINDPIQTMIVLED